MIRALTRTTLSFFMAFFMAFFISTHCGAQEMSPWFSVASHLEHDEAFSGAHDVELSGNLAFVPGKGGTIAIVDVADPTKPELVWFQHDRQQLPDSETVLPLGKHLLLGTRDFLSLDISDPTNPVILKKISDPTRIDRINGMVKRGDHVFAANKSTGTDICTSAVSPKTVSGF
jgi:hypothetical protein